MTTQQTNPQQYQPTFTQILSINDYDEAPEQQTPQKQGLPIEEIEQILSQADTLTSRRQIVLVLAINYLQQRCSELASSNNYLRLRHQDLMDEINYLNEVEINQQVAHNFLQVMQKEVENYREEFHLYRERYLQLRRSVFEENGKLNVRIQELSTMLAQSQQQHIAAEEERDDAMSKNQELLEANAQLNDRLEDLEDELSKLKSEAKYYHSSRTYGNRRIDGEIQAELESLIQKLMRELQSERNQKVKLSNEYKHIQKQLMTLEKELTEKNSKIYELEMISLKTNRLSPQPVKNGKVKQMLQNGHYKYNGINGKHMNGNGATNGQSSKRNGNNNLSKNVQNEKQSSFKTFSLMSLLNQNTHFTKKTRLIIALKVIEFYIRKMKKGEYTTHMLDNLLVYNYSSLYPQACIIRKDKTTSSEDEGECNQQRLIWNLGFILDNLVNQAQDESQGKTQPEIELVDLINHILEENQRGINEVDELKFLTEEAIKLKK